MNQQAKKQQPVNGEEQPYTFSDQATKEKIKRHPSQCTLGVADLPKYKPTYFNAGCCCYSDNSISGIEIADGFVRLVRWAEEEGISKREVLEELPLGEMKDMFMDK